MSEDKTIDPKSTSPDDLTKTTNQGNVELNEEELGKTSGGAVNAYLYLDDKSAPTESVSLNFNKIEF